MKVYKLTSLVYADDSLTKEDILKLLLSAANSSIKLSNSDVATISEQLNVDEQFVTNEFLDSESPRLEFLYRQ